MSGMRRVRSRMIRMRLTEWSRKLIPKTGWRISSDMIIWAICDFNSIVLLVMSKVRRVKPGRRTDHSRLDWQHCVRWPCSSVWHNRLEYPTAALRLEDWHCDSMDIHTVPISAEIAATHRHYIHSKMTNELTESLHERKITYVNGNWGNRQKKSSRKIK